MAIDKFFVKKEHRLQVLSLLCEFIHHGPPHLHQLLQTPLFGNLLLCLQIDTSTTVVSLALTALIMFLPHIPDSIAPHLPSLFKIYSRILFWERERTAPSAAPDQPDPEKQTDGSDDIFEDSQWEKAPYSAESDGEKVPELLHYFTFLYGLYPINFMSYIRKPNRYLRHANLPDAEDIDVQPSEIRQRSEPFRQLHLLHPNFYTMTIESEVKNKNRWIHSEAADVVATCIALRGPITAYSSPTAKPSEVTRSQQPNGDIPEQPLLGNSEELAESRPVSEATEGRDPSWRNTTSTVVAPSESELHRKLSQGSQHTRMYDDSPTLKPQSERLDSPTLPPQLLLTGSQLQEEESLLARNSLYESANESEVSMLSNLQTREPSIVSSYLQSLAQHQMAHSASSGQSPPDETPNVASLHREIMLLKNDLNFERFLKQQHLSHIGQLRSKHVREATVEAETQYLINSNKGLRNKLEDAKSSALQMKKESEKSRTHSKKWEAELTAKLRALREEQKKSKLEVETLRRELAGARGNCLQLRQLVVASEANEFAARQKLQSIEVTLGEHSKLRTEVEKLTATVRSYEAAEMENERARASEALAMTKVEILEMKLRAQEAEIFKAKLATDREIQTLKAKLGQAMQSLDDTTPRGWQSILDSALASSRAKLMESQKAHAHLLLKFTNLQAQYLALQSSRDPDEPLLSSGDTHSHCEVEYSYPGSAPDHRRMRSRGLSDSNALERTSYDLTPPSGSTAYIPIRPAPRADTFHSSRDTRPASQSGHRSPPHRLTSSELAQHVTQHVRAGSADGTQHFSEERDSAGQLKIKPQSEVRVYGRGSFLYCQHLIYIGPKLTLP
jgi:solute carrier family 25 (mitochondrial carrier protein), member 16